MMILYLIVCAATEMGVVCETAEVPSGTTLESVCEMRGSEVQAEILRRMMEAGVPGAVGYDCKPVEREATS